MYQLFFSGTTSSIPNGHGTIAQMNPAVVTSANYIPPRQVYHSSVQSINSNGSTKSSSVSTDIDAEVSKVSSKDSVIAR